MAAPTQAQKMAAMAPNFPVQAWGPDGSSVYTLNGPIAPERLYSTDDHVWTDKDTQTVLAIAKQYPDRLPHGLTAKISHQIGCAPKTFLNKMVEARKSLEKSEETPGK